MGFPSRRRAGKVRVVARGSQFLDHAFFLLYALLGIRLVLALIAARSGTGFVRFIATITDPFYAPFRGIVESPTTDGGNTLVVPIIVALVAYALLHAAVNALLRMVGTRKTAI
ncbi:MAG: YggT family protein [Gemmatimonadaceae bacterium]|nr:YggT family protein [Gemmatimonadaceae bacterium]